MIKPDAVVAVAAVAADADVDEAAVEADGMGAGAAVEVDAVGAGDRAVGMTSRGKLYHTTACSYMKRARVSRWFRQCTECQRCDARFNAHAH